MNKKLMAVAVAGALAAPGVALAQASSVTISGFFKVGLESLSYSNQAAGVSRLNNSQMRVVDNSSRIIFNSVEDLGNGLAAVGQLDVRFAPDQQGSVAGGNPIGSGNTFVGLKSNTWGMLTTGRWDLHYGKQPDDIAAKAGALEATAISLMDYIGQQSIANATRTQNVVKYDSPNWSGFAATVAWSANPGNPLGGEADMTLAANGVRKGDAWNFNPSYSNGPLNLGYSYWRAKNDNPVATSLDQRGDVIYGSYVFGGFKIGLAWNRSRLDTAVDNPGVGSGTKAAQRSAWTIPASYNWGPHTVVGHYTRANSISTSIPGADGNNTGARMVAIAYVYDLSKRTSLAATYAQIRNDENANYNFFTSNSLGSSDAVTTAGEDARLFQVSIKHAF
jgi:predicted porin